LPSRLELRLGVGPCGRPGRAARIEADGAGTAIVHLVVKSYDAAAQLLFTQQSRHRIAADGGLTLVSIDVQFSTTGTNRQLCSRV
jgi:hypothetical protein